MNLEIGERIVFRSLHWEVADNSAESYVELFGHSRENQGRTVPIASPWPPILKRGQDTIHDSGREP